MFNFLKKKLDIKTETFEFNVAGVTFKNGRKTRQAILRTIKYHNDPFDKVINVTMKQYDYEGNPAIGVYVNEQQIGNVPSNHIQYLIDNFSKMICVSDFKVIGGYEGKTFGAIVTISMKK